MTKKIIIIGSQGYLGSRLTSYLKNCGYHCSGIDTGFFKNGTLTAPDNIETRTLDARLLTEKYLEEADVVILLAGISNDPFGEMTSEQIYDPTRDYALNIASMCKKLGIKFIYPSSCSIYGAAGNDFLQESDQTNPQTPYSLNKLQVEEGLSLISDNTFSPIALRFGTVYGMSPRIRFDVVINMLCGLALTKNQITLNSNGEAWRPHLHIDDACESFRCCIEWDNRVGELCVFNVGQNEDNRKVIDIAKIVQKNVEGSVLNFLNQDSDDSKASLIKDRKIQDGVDTRTYKVSFDKIHKTLPGFKCRWNIESGIKHLLSELRNIELNSSVFNRREFYRLQQIEHLHKTKQINDDLFWVK
jgi:nucleoside-diphosphate-sugar epimerase